MEVTRTIAFQPVERKHPHVFQDYVIINSIVSVIPEEILDIVDSFLIVMGITLNVVIVLVVLFSSSLRTSTGCYLVNLACSNFVLLLDSFRQIFRSLYQLDLDVNVDYIFHVSFDVSILTIIAFSIERYRIICQRVSPTNEESAFEVSTAIHSIVFIWIISVTVTAMELNLYDQFEEDAIHEIYVAFTLICLVMPCIVFLILHGMILYQLWILKSVEGTWRDEDMDVFRLLIAVTMVFFLTVAPYRIAKTIDSMTSTSLYSDGVLQILYTMVKMFAVVLPTVCLVTSQQLRKALQEILQGRCNQSQRADASRDRDPQASVED